MAKKDKTEEQTSDSNDELQKIIEKKYGKIMFSGSHIKENPKVLIPTTPTLDLSLRGGIPEGSWTLISGRPKTGKTSLSLQIAANAQRMGRHVYYLNVEHRFGEKNLSTVRHLKTTPDCFTLIESTREKILTSQDFLNIACDIVANKIGCVIILDSISSLCSQNEMNKEIGDIGRADGPRMFGQFCRHNASIIPINNVIFIGMLHVIANTSGFGAPTMEDGGNKIQFQADNKIKVKGVSKWEEGSGENTKLIGQIVDFEIAFSANGPPGDVVKTYLRYGFGFDDIFEITCLGIDMGLILKSGAWFQYQPSEGESIKFQGQSKLYEYFKQNENELKILHQNIKNMVN